MTKRWRAKEWIDSRGRELKLLGAVLFVAVAVLVFWELGSAVQEGPLSFDERLLLAMRHSGDVSQGLGGETVQSMVRDLTGLGSPIVMVVFGAVLAGYLVVARRPADAIFVVACLIGCWLLNDTLKSFFARERPTIVPHLMTAREMSFPSGHTLVAAAFYPTVAALAASLTPWRRLRVYLLAIGILAAVLVGMTRVYLGVHYPSDVLGGLCVGFAWALLARLGLNGVRTLFRRYRDAERQEARTAYAEE